MLKILVRAKLLALMMLPALSACESSGDSAEDSALRGILTIKDIVLEGEEPLIELSSASCEGVLDFADIREGTAVVVKDSDGAQVAVTTLGKGKDPIQKPGPGRACEFPFSVAELPVLDEYRIQVAERPEAVYSLARLERANWDVQLTLAP